ncbi:MAG: kynureninase, partial [Flavobacteriales bacterium]|nr:kynureninase [Flavobacteriales bacterium]
MKFKNTFSFASNLDVNDKLKNYRSQFYIPLQKNGTEHIYLCGNSLGLQPKITRKYLDQELNDWASLGVEGHFHAKNPWLPYHEYLTESYSKIVGAKKTEVIAMNTLTVNLHLMMVTFY